MWTREGLSFVLRDEWSYFHLNLCLAYEKTKQYFRFSTVFIIYLCVRENVSKEPWR